MAALLPGKQRHGLEHAFTGLDKQEVQDVRVEYFCELISEWIVLLCTLKYNVCTAQALGVVAHIMCHIVTPSELRVSPPSPNSLDGM